MKAIGDMGLRSIERSATSREKLGLAARVRCEQRKSLAAAGEIQTILSECNMPAGVRRRLLDLVYRLLAETDLMAGE